MQFFSKAFCSCVLPWLMVFSAAAQAPLVSEWTVTVHKDPHLRTLQIRKLAAPDNGVSALDARYGMQGEKLKPVRAEITQDGPARKLQLVTPAGSVIAATQTADGVFEGSIAFSDGKVKPVRVERIGQTAGAAARPPATPPDIHMVVMGGNDCPPCVAWRGLELPKLQQTAAFQAIRFSYVTKVITSPVPASLFLPDEVKPYKDQLDAASSGRSGSPQVAIMVNGQVHDYYFGTRSAEQIVQMIEAIQTGGAYPVERCLKRGGNRQCLKPA